ncbi:MAG: secondary thiamine-phosphate synthase enzyme YjbQ [Methanobacteriota archaeon]
MIRFVTVKTSREVQFIDITSEVERVVRESGVKEGAANIFTKHTTTAIIINENEPGLLRDYEKLVELVPKGGGYEHDRIDDNAHSHLRSILLGPNKVVPIIEGSLALGTWQRIFLAEFDGPRVREVVVQVFHLF